MDSENIKILDNKEISKLTFENALQQLEKIVSKIENTNSNLEDAILYYEYATNLKQHLNKKLTEAKLKISKISDS